MLAVLLFLILVQHNKSPCLIASKEINEVIINTVFSIGAPQHISTPPGI